MSKLILKKECKGYYSNQSGPIRIAVSRSQDGKEWQGTIENQDEIEDEKFLVYEAFGETKKEVVEQIVRFLETL